MVRYLFSAWWGGRRPHLLVAAGCDGPLWQRDNTSPRRDSTGEPGSIRSLRGRPPHQGLYAQSVNSSRPQGAAPVVRLPHAPIPSCRCFSRFWAWGACNATPAELVAFGVVLGTWIRALAGVWDSRYTPKSNRDMVTRRGGTISGEKRNAADYGWACRIIRSRTSMGDS